MASIVDDVAAIGARLAEIEGERRPAAGVDYVDIPITASADSSGCWYCDRNLLPLAYIDGYFHPSVNGTRNQCTARRA